MKLTHVDDGGSARMVDVSGKVPVRRTARARGKIRLTPHTVELIKDGLVGKGDVLGVARVARLALVAHHERGADVVTPADALVGRRLVRTRRRTRVAVREEVDVGVGEHAHGTSTTRPPACDDAITASAMGSDGSVVNLSATATPGENTTTASSRIGAPFTVPLMVPVPAVVEARVAT